MGVADYGASGYNGYYSVDKVSAWQDSVPGIKGGGFASLYDQGGWDSVYENYNPMSNTGNDAWTYGGDTNYGSSIIYYGRRLGEVVFQNSDAMDALHLEVVTHFCMNADDTPGKDVNFANAVGNCNGDATKKLPIMDYAQTKRDGPLADDGSVMSEEAFMKTSYGYTSRDSNCDSGDCIQAGDDDYREDYAKKLIKKLATDIALPDDGVKVSALTRICDQVADYGGDQYEWGNQDLKACAGKGPLWVDDDDQGTPCTMMMNLLPLIGKQLQNYRRAWEGRTVLPVAPICDADFEESLVRDAIKIAKVDTDENDITGSCPDPEEIRSMQMRFLDDNWVKGIASFFWKG